jgi:anti-anti-sigma regulatory factor
MSRKPNESTALRTSTKVSSAVAVVTLVGRLEPSAMSTCRAALDAVVRVRAPRLVLDLSRAELQPESIAMLTWMHRYAGHFGITLTLTGVSRVVTRILEQEHLDSVFQVRPTNHAQRRATARADHRDQWPGSGRRSTLPPESRTRQGPA